MPIRFFSEEIDFKLSQSRKIKQWIIDSARNEHREISEINFIFCSDTFLLDLNLRYLKHNTFTDIVTFDNSIQNSISGEIYISIDRVKENARQYLCEFKDELLRVIIHGVLHLCGYKDKSPGEKAQMRKKEEAYLSLWRRMFHVKR